MTLSTLTDTELNERIHLAMGHEKCPCAMTDCERWVIDGNPQYWPEYPNSLDAMKSGPEKQLRDAGWQLASISTFDEEQRFHVEWFHSGHGWKEAFALTEERARAEAVCQGLEVSK